MKFFKKMLTAVAVVTFLKLAGAASSFDMEKIQEAMAAAMSNGDTSGIQQLSGDLVTAFFNDENIKEAIGTDNSENIQKAINGMKSGDMSGIQKVLNDQLANFANFAGPQTAPSVAATVFLATTAFLAFA